MNKNQSINDVIPPTKKRSIRDIPIPERKKMAHHSENIKKSFQKELKDINDSYNDNMGGDNNYNLDDEKPIKVNHNYYNETHSYNKILFAGVSAIILIIFVLVSYTYFGSKAIVNIAPKTTSADINKTILIEDSSLRKNTNSLTYRTVNLAKEEEITVDANEEKLVQEKSSGTITIYNNFSKIPQKLIKNTRFETPDGKIFRINESITIPGFIEENGEKKPGQIDAIVYADQIGSGYNISSSDFKIPGFKNTEQYDLFWAKTKTSISGGYDGIKKIISVNDIENSKITLKNNLRNKLITEINNQIPDDYYLLLDESSFVFGEITQEDLKSENKSKLKMKADISAIIFNKIDLSNKISENVISKINNSENFLIVNLSEINIKLTTLEKEKYLQVSGLAKFIWQIDKESITDILLGIKKADFTKIISRNSSIKSAELKMTPIWKKKIPKNPDDIKIIINN